MSITPGWEEKEFDDLCPGLPVAFEITQDQEFYYLNNGQEFKKWPNTKEGWSDLCDELKSFTP